MSALAGTGGLVRLILRRDRVLMPIWVLLFGVMPMNFIVSMEGLYSTAAERLQYAHTSGTNPTFLGLYGPLYDSSAGALATQRGGATPVFLALVCILTVIRHTRTEEEAGRRELVGSTVVGRHAGLAAALIVTMAANLVIALLIVLTAGAQDVPMGGVIALALAWASVGCVFTAVAGVAAQLSQSAAAARSIGGAILGGMFVVRLAGDVGGQGSGLSWLGWLSPLGWAHRLRPFAGERWWVLALPLVLTAVLVTAAVALSARRDVGAGILQPRPGPAVAAGWLRTPLALAWRLQRPSLLGWLACFAGLGLVFGGMTDGVADMVKDNPDLEEIFTKMGGAEVLVDAYVSTTMGVVALIASAQGIQAMLRLRAEETNLHAEQVLAAAVGRTRWVAGHVLFAIAGPAAAVTLTGVVSGLVSGLVSGDVGGQVSRFLSSALVQLPAVWLLAGVALALFGLLPRYTPAAWAVLAACVLLGQFGATLGFDQWMLDLSPFTHVPKVPGADLSLTPMLWLTAIALALTATGLTTFRHRDVPTT